MESKGLHDYAAIKVELMRLRRIEAKVDRSVRDAIARCICELQARLPGSTERARRREFTSGVRGQA
jgi:hypothetical protein